MGNGRFAHLDFLLVAAAFAALVCMAANAAGQWDPAIYALSVWNYVVYALAFYCRQISLDRFKADAIGLKIMALVPFALVYGEAWVPGWSGWASLVVIAAGFGLNVAAAHAIGSDRTYYGFELANMPEKWCSEFPYSITSHPMLIGNMLAFAGTLLNDGFRIRYWPLAILHVALNGLILAMETKGHRRILFPVLGAALLAAGGVSFAIFFSGTMGAVLTILAAMLGFMALIVRRYTYVTSHNRQNIFEGNSS